MERARGAMLSKQLTLERCRRGVIDKDQKK